MEGEPWPPRAIIGARVMLDLLDEKMISTINTSSLLTLWIERIPTVACDME
jgi:hypothetical protein